MIEAASWLRQASIAPRRWALRPVLAILLAAFGCTAVSVLPQTRTALLRTAGWILVVDPPIRPSDVIIVSVGSYAAGALEAADLVAAGISKRVVVVAEPRDTAETEFIRRGAPFSDATDTLIYQLSGLGVKHVERLPLDAEGTESQGQVLAKWISDRGFRSITAVTTRDHSRRVARVLKRSLPRIVITVRASQYSTFDPDRWWRTRDGIRLELVELQKLVFDILRHPLS